MALDNSFIIFIPSLFSTSLLKGDEIIWPIKNLDVILKLFKKKISNVNKKNEKEEDTIDDILKKSFERLKDDNLMIGPLHNCKNMINYIKSLVNENYYIFNYDWRLDIETIVWEFKKTFQNLKTNNKKIIFITHSLGGIILYSFLNNKKYECLNIEKTKEISKCFYIGCPFKGSIKTLYSLLGFNNEWFLEPKYLKDILNENICKSLFQLIPYNYNFLFFEKNDKRLLKNKEVIDLLLKNGVSEEMLYLGINFVNEFNTITEENTFDQVFIIGNSPKSKMCVYFNIDLEKNIIEPIHDTGSGDGTLLFHESIINEKGFSKIRYIHGKHSYLTEYDELYEIINQEILKEIVTNNLISKTLYNSDNSIVFELFVLSNDVYDKVFEIKSEKIIFVNKTYTLDVTNDLKNKKGFFTIKNKYEYGNLKFKNLTVKTKENKFFFKNTYINLNKPTTISFI